MVAGDRDQCMGVHVAGCFLLLHVDGLGASMYSASVGGNRHLMQTNIDAHARSIIFFLQRSSSIFYFYIRPGRAGDVQAFLCMPALCMACG